MTNSSPDTLKRQWQMLRMIPRHPATITAAEMQRRLEQENYAVSKRTVERDLQALSSEFPLVLDERSKPFGWSWKADAPHFNVPGLSDNEALAFVMLEQHLKNLLPASALSQLQPYFKAAGTHLNETPRSKQTRSWLDKVRTVPPAQPLLPAPINEEVQQVVYGALLADRQLSIRYQKRGEAEPAEYRLQPLAVIQRGPVSYLCCLTDKDDRLRTFAMHRIVSVTLLDDRPAKIPASFSIDKFIASGELGFGNGKQIRLEAVFYDGQGDHLHETPISAEQKLTDMGDGRLKLSATVVETPQLTWWLLGLGDGVEVIKPISLRKDIAETAARMVKRYR